LSLEGRIALITYAAQTDGIGQGVVMAFLSAGASASYPPMLIQAKAAIRAKKGRVERIRLDFTGAGLP
jgi:hypothetical protein